MASTHTTAAGILAAWLTAAVAVPAAAQPVDLGVAPVVLRDEPYLFDTAEQHGIRVSVVVRGLAHPFGLAFLPNGDALITERGKRLRLVRNAANGGPAKLEPEPVAGTPPEGFVRPTIGLLDVAVHPRFADNRFVYFTYNKPGEGEASLPRPERTSALVLARGVLDGNALRQVEDLYVAPFARGSAWASRIAFGLDGTVYVTSPGPAVDGPSQDRGSPYGKVLRLSDDGGIPADNPFVNDRSARPEVFSLGHRDHHGLAVHPLTGAVLNAEHGPNGGDEVNLILPGRNYGWPTHTFGRDYDGSRMTESPVGDGIEAPLIVWLPSIAPSGLAVYTGDRFPAWKGNLFVSSARIGEIPRTGGLERVVVNEELGELRRERLLTELRQRIANVRQGPDGLLYVLTDQLDSEDGALLRIEPAPL
ncbi:MAG TPA: PQQ-dependent sugar dehydrogenase [Gammaproteobacteria bacterium]